MRIVVLIVAALLAPIVVLAEGPPWLFWPAIVVALLLLLTIATEWLWRGRPVIESLVPLGLMVVAVIAVALASPGAASWVLWPLVLAALIAVASGLAHVSGRRTRQKAAQRA